MQFWLAAITFVGTYILIASERFNKTVVALAGACIMMLFILNGPSHGSHSEEDTTKGVTNLHKTLIEGSASESEKLGDKTENNKSILDPHKTTTADTPTGAGSHDSFGEKLIPNSILINNKRYESLDVFAKYVNFDVIITLAGMMLLVNILSHTGIFQYIAIKSTKMAGGSPVYTMILLVIATAVLSAFLDNVTTILLIAPVTLIVAAELGVGPIPFLMAETMASNIGGTATLVGDPPNLIIGSVARLDFMAFIYNLMPFIIVVTIFYSLFLFIYYRNKIKVTVADRARIMELNEKAAITDPVNMRRGGIVMILTILGFLIHGAVGIQPSVVAISGATLALIVCKVDVEHALEKIEWTTLFFFIGLFILVSGADAGGVINSMGSLLDYTSTWHPLVVIIVVMWVSGVCAAIMNNVSYTAAMVTIMASFLAKSEVFQGNIELQHLMWWGLALAVCLGGNGTIVGAAANLITVGVAEKAGIKISFLKFLKYGVPITLATLVAATFYISLRYMMITI